MTTHRAHVTLFHNQCLAIQTIVILLDLASKRADEQAVWVYEHAARHVLPELCADTSEDDDEDATQVSARRDRRSS